MDYRRRDGSRRSHQRCCRIALVDEKLRGFINANPELTELFGANAIQGHAVIGNSR